MHARTPIQSRQMYAEPQKKKVPSYVVVRPGYPHSCDVFAKNLMHINVILCASWCSRPCSILFCFVLLARTPAPPSGRLPAAHRKAGSARPDLNILYLILFFFFFTSRIACRGERGAPLFVPILLFLVFYRPADPWGSILFWYIFSRYVSL